MAAWSQAVPALVIAISAARFALTGIAEIDGGQTWMQIAGWVGVALALTVLSWPPRPRPILAYAGSSLPLLILIVANSGSLGSVVTDQVIAQEIVRSVVATLGLIAADPITTALAALTAGSEIPALRRRT